MHEASLARQLLQAVLREVRTPGRIVRVHGHLAETESLSRDSLSLHFDEAARGTAAEGAELLLRLEHVGARCASCGCVYLPEHHLTLCPSCGGTEAELLGEVGLRLTSIEVTST